MSMLGVVEVDVMISRRSTSRSATRSSGVSRAKKVPLRVAAAVVACIGLTGALGWSAAYADSAPVTPPSTAEVTPSPQASPDLSPSETSSEQGQPTAVASAPVTSTSSSEERIVVELTGEVSIPQDVPWSQVKLATASGNYRLIGVDKDINAGVIRSGDTISVTALTSPGASATNHIGRLVEALVPSGHATAIRATTSRTR